jgi:hypothetical protein
MSHKRLAAHAVAPGDNIDDLPYIDQYVCNGCGKTSTEWQAMTRIQGQTFRGGGMTGYLNADLCADCWVNKPFAAIAKGVTNDDD